MNMSGTSVITKMHFVFGLVMFLFIAMMVIEDDMARRAMLLLPIIIFDIITKMLYSMDQIDRMDDILEKYKGGEITFDSTKSEYYENLVRRLDERSSPAVVPAGA